jgi:hypothetical protein
MDDFECEECGAACEERHKYTDYNGQEESDWLCLSCFEEIE